MLLPPQMVSKSLTYEQLRRRSLVLWVVLYMVLICLGLVVALLRFHQTVAQHVVTGNGIEIMGTGTSRSFLSVPDHVSINISSVNDPPTQNNGLSLGGTVSRSQQGGIYFSPEWILDADGLDTESITWLWLRDGTEVQPYSPQLWLENYYRQPKRCGKTFP